MKGDEGEPIQFFYPAQIIGNMGDDFFFAPSRDLRL